MSDDSQRPIIVKRIKKGAHGHHGGAWKIAYADFVTAMMAFFLLMWLLGSTTKADLQGIADFFKTPLKISLMGGSGTGDSTSITKGGGTDITRAEGVAKKGETSTGRKVSDLRRIAIQAREQSHLDALEHLARLVELVLEQGGERADESVGEQDPKERPNQRCGDQLAELRGRQTDRLHGMHYTHHRSHDTECRQRIAHLGDRIDRNLAFVVMRFDLDVHQVFDLERIEIAADHQAQIVGEKFHAVVIAQYAPILGEDWALLRIVDVRFDRHQAFLAHFGEDVVEQGQQFQVQRLRVFGTFQHRRQSLERALDDLSRIRDEECAARGSEDHEQLDGLDQGTEVSAGEGEAPEHGAHDDDVTDDYKHACAVRFKRADQPGRVTPAVFTRELAGSPHVSGGL